MVYSNISNITGITQVASYVTTEEPLVGSVILLLIFLVLFFAMKERFSTSRALGGSSFVTFIVAVILRSLELIGNYPLILSVASVILALIYLKYESE